jgi:hypothetical protein
VALFALGRRQTSSILSLHLFLKAIYLAVENSYLLAEARGRLFGRELGRLEGFDGLKALVDFLQKR